MTNVIIPHYNSTKTIEKTLDSLAAQTVGKGFFVTIVDDGSSPGEKENLESIASRYSDRLNVKTIYKETNEGPGMARQTGIDASTMFDYIMFVDSDDMLMPDAVGRLTREAKVNNADFVVSNIKVEGADKRTSYLKTGENTTWFHGKIYRRGFLVDNEIKFMPQLRSLFNLNEDCFFNLLVYWLAERRFTLNETTYLWRANPDSLTRRTSLEHFYYEFNKDYFMSQAFAMIYIMDLKPNVRFPFEATVANLYKSYQTELLVGNDKVRLEMMDGALAALVELNLKSKIETKEMAKTIISAPQGESLEKDVLFFRQSISEWMKKSGIFPFSVEEKKEQ